MQYSLKSIGRKLLNWSEIVILGSKLYDSNSGLKCFKKDIYQKLEQIIPAPIDMSFSQYLAQMFNMLSATSVQEVLIENSERYAGESKIRMKDFFVAFHQNLRLAYSLKPKRLSYVCALLLFSVVIPYSGLTILLKNSGMPVAGGIAIIIGFVFIILGELRQTAPERELTRLKTKLRSEYHLNTVDKT